MNSSAQSGSNARALFLIGFLAGLTLIHPIEGGARPLSAPSQTCLQASQLVAIANSLRPGSGSDDSYAAVAKIAFNEASEAAPRLMAFEENRSFVYASGVTGPGMFRRFIILKPGTFVIDDEAGEGSRDPGCFASETRPKNASEGFSAVEGGYEIRWRVPVPQKASFEISRSGRYVVNVSAKAESTPQRYLDLISVTEKGRLVPAIRASFEPVHSVWRLTVADRKRVFELWLPRETDGAGEVAISAPDGTSLVDRQPLPSGILPHGPEGNRLLETWDADYRQSRPPVWDIGRPADELRKAVQDGTVQRCKLVDLGCGSGTDAIYLARQGFDVTGIDIAPTALGQAADKARKAGVSVRWILADVTAPPDVGPFDFIYDRGCYHNVRDQNLEAYIETVRRFSHNGTKLLLLSARRDPQSPPRSSGVTEEELRFDFSSLFRVDWLRPIMLESNEAGVLAPGWSALMQREATP